jgi:16S rRNA (cytidine1402-2'-O)-methyltransferase
VTDDVTIGHQTREGLVLVATPIGNLGDLSARAIDTLRRADLVCCEDTRHTGRLLHHAGVSGARLAVANEHTEAARAAEVLDVLAAGGTVAVVTDAGTPGISDPGARLVRVALGGGFPVTAVPGPAALIAALVVSGLDTTRFVFEGFLPRSGRERAARLTELAAERRTTIVYEAPHRLRRTVDDLAATCGSERRVAISRELTKLFEHTWRGTLGDARSHVGEQAPRGEYVLVVEGAPPPAEPDDDVLRVALQESLRAGADRRTAVATVMARHGASKRRVYDIALTIPRHD